MVGAAGGGEGAGVALSALVCDARSHAAQRIRPTMEPARLLIGESVEVAWLHSSEPSCKPQTRLASNRSVRLDGVAEPWEAIGVVLKAPSVGVSELQRRSRELYESVEGDASTAALLRPQSSDLPVRKSGSVSARSRRVRAQRRYLGTATLQGNETLSSEPGMDLNESQAAPCRVTCVLLSSSFQPLGSL
jgi:hypothetical protein